MYVHYYNHDYDCFITCHYLQDGETALDVAKRKNSHKCVKILEDSMVCKIMYNVIFIIIVTCMCNIHFNINLISLPWVALFRNS